MIEEKRTKDAMELYRALAGLIHEGNGTSGVCVSSRGSMDVIYAIIDLIDARIALKKEEKENG
jgi:hypothetical protein